MSEQVHVVTDVPVKKSFTLNAHAKKAALISIALVGAAVVAKVLMEKLPTEDTEITIETPAEA